MEYINALAPPAMFARAVRIEVGHLVAVTVAELGEMLPGELDGGVWYWQECSPRGSVRMWLEWFEDEDGDKRTLDGQSHAWLISARTEADARAKMLVYLLERKLITL
jgi:hypothetical protein